MAAKKRIPPPPPIPNRPWPQLTTAEQNAEYTRALYAYTVGQGPNPQTRGAYYRARAAAAASATTVPH